MTSPGAPNRLIGALILTIVDHIEYAIHQTRSRYVRGELTDTGHWTGEAFLVIEEGWKVTESKAAGAWLNEFARRSRHWRLWLIFVTQLLKDLDNEQGRALMENSSIRLLFRNNKRDLEFGREPLGLTDTDIAAICELQTRPGEYSTVYMQSARGRGQVRSIPGPLEYWICSNHPKNDQPARHAALIRRRRRPLEGAAAAVHARMAAGLPRPHGGLSDDGRSRSSDRRQGRRTRPRRRGAQARAPALRAPPPPPKDGRGTLKALIALAVAIVLIPALVVVVLFGAAQPAAGCAPAAPLEGTWTGPGSLGGVAGTGVTRAELAAARRIPRLGGTRAGGRRVQPDGVLPAPQRPVNELRRQLPVDGERNPRQQRHAPRLSDRV